MQIDPSTVWMSISRRRTMERAIATGATATRRKLRIETYPRPSAESDTKAVMPAIVPSTMMTVAIRTRRLGDSAAASAASSVSPWRMTVASDTHEPVGDHARNTNVTMSRTSTTP